jgi:hypothetical protein
MGFLYNLGAVLFTERGFFLFGEGRGDKADGQPNGKIIPWSFMICSGSSGLSSMIQGRTKERNPPHGGPLPFFLLPRISRHQTRSQCARGLRQGKRRHSARYRRELSEVSSYYNTSHYWVRDGEHRENGNIIVTDDLSSFRRHSTGHFRASKAGPPYLIPCVAIYGVTTTTVERP